MQYSELIPFFKDRLTELFHKDSLDSYRVRHHNTLSILKELRALIEGWQNKNIKRPETVQYCIDEVINIINQDNVFNFSICSKNRFIEILKQFSNELKDVNSKKDKQPSLRSTHLIYLLNKYISQNNTSYIISLWDSIESVLFNSGSFDEKDFMPTLGDLDILIASLAREILNRGYSKREAFMCTQSYAQKDNSLEEFRAFRQKLQGLSLKNFRVILRLYIVGATNPVFSDFHSEIQPDILNDYGRKTSIYLKFIAPATNRRFYIVDSIVADAQSAIMAAKLKLFGELDTIHIGISKMNVAIDAQAIVIEKHSDKDDFISLKPTQFTLDGTFPQDISISNKYRTLLRNIKINQSIDESVKIRIDGALRHLRIANVDSEIEQRFINYWIALEFIFSSPLIEENTYFRLKTNLTNILSVCYVERNLEYLESILRTKGELTDTESINKHNIDSLIDSQISILMKFRLKKFKSRLFTQSDKRKQYLQNHRNNLEAHLSRIYHLRNVLIHEAGINQDIEGLTSNLKYYLIFLLNQMIMYFSSLPSKSSESKVTIDEFFYEYQMMMDNIAEDWDLEKMRNVPFQKDLII